MERSRGRGQSRPEGNGGRDGDRPFRPREPDQGSNYDRRDARQYGQRGQEGGSGSNYDRRDSRQYGQGSNYDRRDDSRQHRPREESGSRCGKGEARSFRGQESGSGYGRGDSGSGSGSYRSHDSGGYGRGDSRPFRSQDSGPGYDRGDSRSFNPRDREQGSRCGRGEARSFRGQDSGYGRGEARPFRGQDSGYGRGRGQGRSFQPNNQQLVATVPKDELQSWEPEPLPDNPTAGSSRGSGEPPMKKHRPLEPEIPNRLARTGRATIRHEYLHSRADFCDKTKKGTSGSPVELQANYFKLLTVPKWVLYQYRVDFSPDESETHIRKRLLRDHREKLKGYVFDGTVMYTPFKLQPCPVTFESVRADNDQRYSIKIKLVGDITPGDYAYYNVFNLIMRNLYAALKLQLIGRDFYDREGVHNIPEFRVQLWPGYKTAIALHENNILMVSEITHKVVRLETALDIFGERYREGGDYRGAFSRDMIGQIVMTDYNNKTYRITDVDWNITPRNTFSMKGTDVTYMDYYQRKFNVKITNLNQPMLISLTKKRDVKRGMAEMICLVPELCRMTGITDKMKNENRFMTAIAATTRVNPRERINKLLEFNRRLQSNAECVEEFKIWDMKLDTNLVTVPARVLPLEQIRLGSKPCERRDNDMGWTFSMRTEPMVLNASVNHWAVIAPRHCEQDTHNFVQMVISTGRQMNFNLGNPRFYIIGSDRIDEYRSKLEEVNSQLNPDCVLCVLPANKTELYNMVKWECSVSRAVISQVVTYKTIRHKSAKSIATKVAIQLNSKLGGRPWAISMPLEHPMVIGYDICHDARDKKKSYGATVAMWGKQLTGHYSCVSQHSNGEELASEFSLSIRKVMREYMKQNGSLPSLVLIYRDGVGDGQMSYVLDHEVEAIKDTLKQLYGNKACRMIFIVVSKRLNTRFFLKSENPSPGTVVDDIVTLPDRYDFFLVSQSVRQGTVAPTSYSVLHNTSGLCPDRIHRLTYKLCHMYFNFSGQVRVPAPCQYAHKLAFLVSQHLSQTPNESLNVNYHYL